MNHFSGWDEKKNEGWSRKSASTLVTKHDYRVMGWKWIESTKKFVVFVHHKNGGCHVEWTAFATLNPSKMKAMGKLQVSTNNLPPPKVPFVKHIDEFVQLWNRVIEL
jgi:hypothetical protein